MNLVAGTTRGISALLAQFDPSMTQLLYLNSAQDLPVDLELDDLRVLKAVV